MPKPIASFRHMAVLFAATLCIAGPALAGNESRYRAFPLENGQFEVVADFTENAIYWCGAGLFAQQKMSKSPTDLIYVVLGPSASASLPGETAVRFGFALPAGQEPVSTYTNDVDVVGNVLSVIQAKQGCTERSASG